VRVQLIVRDNGSTPIVRFNGPRDAYTYLKDEAETWDREHFIVFLLSNKMEVVGVETVAIGSLTAAIVHPREVFKAALLANAAAIILAHNHPSGDPTPSKEDITITRRLKECAEIFGIRCIDHIVIGRGRYVSFVDDGYWEA
jgi:DNA repair protein RadC